SYVFVFFFFFSSRRRHTSFSRDWSSDVCSSDLPGGGEGTVCGDQFEARPLLWAGKTAIEHSDAVVTFQAGRDDVPADEAGAAKDEDTQTGHQRSPGPEPAEA